MNKQEKIIETVEGLRRFYEVKRHSEDYFFVLGTHLHTSSLFGALIRWFERSEGSHSKLTAIHKATGQPYVDLHALEGWGGGVCTVPDLFVTGKTACEYRMVQDCPKTKAIVEEFLELMHGTKYERPFGFVTKSRKNDPDKWFCSEATTRLLGKLQNCDDALVSPPWARRSIRCASIYGWLDKDGFRRA